MDSLIISHFPPALNACAARKTGMVIFSQTGYLLHASSCYNTLIRIPYSKEGVLIMTSNRNKTFRICFIGLMAAIVFVVNYLRIPFMGTQLHMTNALCVLCGLLFGPGAGFLAAGLGSGLYDIVAGWGAECVITFINKGVIALVAGLIAYGAARKDAPTGADHARVIVGSVLGALAYVALYMLKTFVFGQLVDGLTLDAVVAKMLTKLPGSLMNAAFAFIVAPILLGALRPALKKAGLYEKL